MNSVFFDIDTQLDFLYPAGALYAPGAEAIEPALAQLTRFASAHRIPIVSTADAHAENDPEFRIWKPHCVVGTQGQMKCSASLLPQSSTGQTIVEKQQIDPFTNPHLPVLLDQIGAERFVVYGLILEYCVKDSLFRLLRRGARVELVLEATCSLNPREGQQTLDRFTSEGGTLITLADACR